MVIGSLVNGLMPGRCLVAGFFTTTNFANPGRMNDPDFFSSLWPTSIMVSRTVATCFLETPSPSLFATASTNALLVMFFAIFRVSLREDAMITGDPERLARNLAFFGGPRSHRW